MTRRNRPCAPRKTPRKLRALGHGLEILEDRTTPTGTITGAVWNDLNGNGVRDPEDVGVGGRVVFLDTNRNGRLDSGETARSTEPNGTYTFTGLSAGTYTVAELLPTGWQQSAPVAAQTVTLTQTTQTGVPITFDFSEYTSTTDQTILAYHKSGFTFDTSTTNTPKFRIFGSGSGSWYAGSAALSSEWAPVTIKLQQDNGQPFNLRSLSLAEFGGPTFGGTVTFVGNKVGGGTVSQVFTMDGQYGFQTVNFTGFDNLTSVIWLNTGSSPNSYHQFDNVVVDGTTITASDAAGIDFGTTQTDAPSVSVGNVTEPEGSSGARTLNVPVTLSAANEYPVTVYYHTANGTATGGSPPFSGPGDYTIAQGSVTIPAFETLGLIPITVNGEATWENDETFLVQLDSTLNATLGTASSTVTLQNDDVLAANDVYNATQATDLTVAAPGVLNNDKGITGSPLTAELVSNPANGSVTLNADGSFTYTPNASFIGSDTFTYRAVSGGYSATATVTLLVHGPTRPTLTVPAAQTFPEDTALTFSQAVGTAIRITDSAIGSNLLDLSLSAASGAITFPQMSGVTVVAGANGSTRMTVRGTLDDLNAALDGVTYLPAANYTGNTIGIGVVVSDGAGDGDQRSIGLNVTPVNDAPVNYIPTTAVATNEDNGVTIPKPTVSDIDNQPPGAAGGVRVTFSVPAGLGTILVGINSGDALTVTGNSTNQVTLDGTLANFNSGLASIVFYPAANINGTVPLTMMTSDKGNFGAGGELFDTDTILITVNPVNDAPVAAGDSYTTAEDVTLTVAAPGLLANDSDVDGPTLSAVLSSPPRGALTLNADGSFTYTPPANFFGTDTFTYRAYDGTAYSNNVLVTITVTSVNDVPVATNDTYTVAEDGVLTVDSPPTASSDMVVRYTFDEATSGTATAIDSGTGPASNGTFTGAATRSSPGVGASPGALDVRSGAGYLTGGDADEVDGLSAMTVTMWVNLAANPLAGDRLIGNWGGSFPTPPAGTRGWYLNINNSFTGGTATASAFAVSANFASSNGTSSGSTGITSTAVYNAANQWAFVAFTVDPNDPQTSPGTTAVTLYSANAANGVFSVNRGVGFPALSGGINTADLTVGGSPYEGSEKTPPGMIDDVRIYRRALTRNELETVRQEGAGTARVGVLANDTDADNDPLTASVVSGPAHGTLSLDPFGKFTYTPEANFSGTDSFTYKATDGTADSNIATVTITVAPVNDAPVGAPESYSTNEDTPLTVPAAGVLANDTDIDSPTLTAVLVNGPTFGSLALNADGGFTYTPNANYNGNDFFSYKPFDGQAYGNLTTVALAVNAVNDAPTAANDGYTTAEDTPLTVAAPGVLANDTDIDGDALAAVLVSGPSHGTLALNANGSFTYTPNANYNGSDSFTYRASDGQAQSGVATASIAVTPVNDAPVASAGPDQMADEPATVSFSASGSFDIDGDPLTYSWDFGDGTTGTGLTPTHIYIDNAPNSGTYTVTLTVNDGHGGTSTDTLVVNVRDVAPTAGVSGPATGVRGQSRTFALTASDPSPVDRGAPFGYRIDWGDGTTGTASGSGSVPVSHTFTGTGNFTIRVWATDKDGLEGPATSFAYTSKAVEVQGSDLVIGGTTAGDQVVLTATNVPNAVKVKINNVDQGTFTAAGQLIVFAQAGDDTVSFATTKVQGKTHSVAQALLLLGGDGNDTLDARNATGPAAIVGGNGNDTLYASAGRSILVGGAGADVLRGGAADDILIGGITDHDGDLVALAALRAEWARTDANYAMRQAHLLGPTGGLNGAYFLAPARVHDDGGAVDNLYGNGAQDWFFAAPTDRVNDRASNETITGL